MQRFWLLWLPDYILLANYLCLKATEYLRYKLTGTITSPVFSLHPQM